MSIFNKVKSQKSKVKSQKSKLERQGPYFCICHKPDGAATVPEPD
jgi:hypothetical protein